MADTFGCGGGGGTVSQNAEKEAEEVGGDAVSKDASEGASEVTNVWVDQERSDPDKGEYWHIKGGRLPTLVDGGGVVYPGYTYRINGVQYRLKQIQDQPPFVKDQSQKKMNSMPALSPAHFVGAGKRGAVKMLAVLVADEETPIRKVPVDGKLIEVYIGKNL